MDLQGILLGKGPVKIFLAYPACPAYRDYLYRYIEGGRIGHIHREPANCFEEHRSQIE